MSEPLVKRSRKGFKLTRAGFEYVTRLLEEGGYFPEIDMAGFETNHVWAGIMGTHMVEASTKYLEEMGRQQKTHEWTEDEESEVALVALYSAIAQAQVEKSSS